MRLADLPNHYSYDDLRKFSDDRELRYLAYSPFFRDLYRNILIYRERFLALIEVPDLEVSLRGIRGTAHPIVRLQRRDIPLSYQRVPLEPWQFSSDWEWMIPGENSFHCPYAGFTLWSEYDLVKRAADYAQVGDVTSIVSELK